MTFYVFFQGLAINVPPEDYFTRRLTEVKHIGLQWADTAKNVWHIAVVSYYRMVLLFIVQLLIVFLSIGLDGWWSTGT